jgi:hypothetical protein
MDNESETAIESAEVDTGLESVLDEKELHSLDDLTKRYEKLTAPGPLVKVGKKAIEAVPPKFKEISLKMGEAITEKQLYEESMKIVATGFKVLEEQAAKVTISEKAVVDKVNKVVDNRDIVTLDQVCLARSYSIAKLANAERLPNLGIAFVEGAATGFPGFAGIPFNIVLSTFCYYRAVQSIALFYGFDVKNDRDELMIASEVFSVAMSPTQGGSSEMGNLIGKIMLISEAEVIKQTVKKGWASMAARGGVSLFITQLRALANGAAKKALERAGQEGLENAVFRSVFEQIGKRLSQKTIQRAVPFVSALIGALFDTAQMNKVLDFADVFYQKRFILEKEQRTNLLKNKGLRLSEDPSESEMEIIEAIDLES